MDQNETKLKSVVDTNINLSKDTIEWLLESRATSVLESVSDHILYIVSEGTYSDQFLVYKAIAVILDDIQHTPQLLDVYISNIKPHIEPDRPNPVQATVSKGIESVQTNIQTTLFHGPTTSS